jgi:hypothetical protein
MRFLEGTPGEALAEESAELDLLVTGSRLRSARGSASRHHDAQPHAHRRLPPADRAS